MLLLLIPTEQELSTFTDMFITLCNSQTNNTLSLFFYRSARNNISHALAYPGFQASAVMIIFNGMGILSSGSWLSSDSLMIMDLAGYYQPSVLHAARCQQKLVRD